MFKNQPKKSVFLPLFLISLLLLSIYYLFSNSGIKVYNNTEFKNIIKTESKSKFSKITISPHEKTIDITGVLIKDGKPIEFQTTYTNTERDYNYLIDQLNQKVQSGAGVTITKPSTTSIWSMLWNLFIFVGPIILIMFILSKTGPGRGMEFGKSRARLSRSKTTTFKHVAGAKEEKEELSEMVDFLKGPNRYVKAGARIPKGVLLIGPPGTGKTLLAKAVAGEANVPFFTIAGSDFVEMFVGVGASRVRSMFKEAKMNAPCIIFIDEIDAVGRQRGSGMGGGHDEREQTLNQLLVELDGFSDNQGIIVIAATNRDDVLDPALLRPGRFDRKITVYLPDVYAREEILKVHSKGKRISTKIDFANIARRTPGFSGADLENVLNEAALLSVREKVDKITIVQIDEAIDRVIGGPAKKSRKSNLDEQKLIAYHESGHAIIGLRLVDAEIVQKVTIIPRGAAGGYVLMTPKKESFLLTKTQLFHKIVSFLGGRVSEQIHFGKEAVTTGSSDDIKKATAIARKMVTEFGMSDLGPIKFESQSGSVFIGRDFTKAEKHYSDKLGYQIDLEIKKLMDKAEAAAYKIISKNVSKVKEIAEALLKHETLTAEMIEAIDKFGDPFGKKSKTKVVKVKKIVAKKANSKLTIK